MLKAAPFFLFVLLLTVGGAIGQVTGVTSPSSRNDVKACADYAEEVLLDRWDMNERTDLGWRIFNTVEQPLSYLQNISFLNGIFSAQSVYTPGGAADDSDVNITILDSAYLGAAAEGKVGTNYPINASKYTRLALRMSLQPDAQGWSGQLFWSKNTMYGGITTSNAFYVYTGWFYYIIDIPSLGIVAGSDPWSGWVDFLRLDPVFKKDKNIQIDWIRLVQHDAALERTITWTGTGNVDIYLDDDSNSGNGNLGLLARNVAGTSYTFLAGALAAGDYYVAVAPTGTTNFVYASGFYRVNEVPVLAFLKPSAEGSDQDYISVQFSDPWDMANSQDVEVTLNVLNPQFTTLAYEDMSGRTYTGQTVFLASSAVDPIVFFLHHYYRGGSTPIDTNRYHNLTFKMGIQGAQSAAEGSVARVIWKRNDESLMNVSQDIVIHHLPDRWIMHKVVCDMKTLPLEEGAGSPSHSGWTGLVDDFRIDPHEFDDGRAFFYDDVRLTSDWTVNTSFPIEWTVSEASHNPAVSLYYDTDSAGYNGTLIVSGLESPPGNGSYIWDTSAVPEGTYWVYAIISDGINTNRTYALGPVIILHGTEREISLSRSTVRFGVVQNGVATEKEKVLVSEASGGTLNWQASSVNGLVTVNPSSGTGDAEIEIRMATTNLTPGSYTDRLRIVDAGAVNSPRYVDVFIQVYAPGYTAGPFGVMDTPVEGAQVFGSVPVTGWALDDIEVVRVEIKRAPHALDPPAAIGEDGLVYVGDGLFIPGARPDVEAAYPGYPLNYRAGWGFMVLTYGLPNQGNGTFTLYAFGHDREGNRVMLGQKTIYGDNAHSVLPFGTIDTPTQGGTASGTGYVNFGWALTPPPNMIPLDGSTLRVWVDGVGLGHPVYNNYRSDIATQYPGYANSNGAVGYYYLNTTGYENGLHTIGWSVADNAGNATGIGSRFFTVLNMGGDAAAGLPVQDNSRTGGGSFQRPGEYGSSGWPRTLDEVLNLPVRFGGLHVRRGYGEGEEGEAITADANSVFRVSIREVERVEMELEGEQRRAGSSYAGYLVVGEKLRSLPIGSTLDPETGLFSWQLGPGFLGEYRLIFVRTEPSGLKERTTVAIEIIPKF